MWRIVRRLLAIFIQLFVWHPVAGLVVAVVAVGAIGIGLGGSHSLQLLQGQVTPSGVVSSRVPAPATNVSVQSAPSVAPPPSVTQYIRGMTSFNAQLMWDALDQQAIQAMQSQGGSQQQLQQRLDDAKNNGASYEDVTYVGGYPLQNGQKYFFYVVSRRGFASPGQFDQVFFVFTVGPNGKIVKIE